MSTEAPKKEETKTTAAESKDKKPDDPAVTFKPEIDYGLKQLISASLRDSKEGWEFSHEMASKIRVYTRDWNDGSPRGVCGVGIVDAAPLRVLLEVSNCENWRQWDPMLKDVEYKQLADHLRLYHLYFHGVFPYQARDVVYIELNTGLEDGSFVLSSRQVKHDTYPEKPDDYVRAKLKAGGWHIRPVKDNPQQSEVTYFMHSDPDLAIVPTFIINWSVSRFPAIIDKVREGCKKEL